jgi:MarR family transcriptional regulator, organic hydroperoxide resistance regulator
MGGSEAGDRLKDQAERIDPIFAQVGAALKKIRWAFERDVGMGAPKYFVLQLLAAEDGISQGEVGQHYNVDPSRVTRLAKLLEREGLIERTRDLEDNRVVRLHLTPEGRRVVERACERSWAFGARIGDALSEGEQAQLLRLLGKLTEAMEDAGREAPGLRVGGGGR